jgi:hypothetical protein
MLSSVLFIALLQSPSPAPALPQRKDLCEVRVRGASDLQRLSALVGDLDDHSPVTDGWARIYGSPAEEARLLRLGWELRVVQTDLADWYAQRAAQPPHPLVMGGSMGGFKTLAEIGAEMDRLATTYPALVSPKFSIGSSIEGRALWCMRVSDNPGIEEPGEPIVFYDALHHAREPMSAEALLLFVDWLCTNYASDPTARRIVDTRQLYLAPCANPDGYEYNRATNPNGGGMWRKNRRNNNDGTFGVDLNRNYGWQWGPQWNGSSGVTGSETYRGPSPNSEPEVQALEAFQSAHHPVVSVSNHTYSNLWLIPWGYDLVFTQDNTQLQWYVAQFAALNGWAHGTVPQVLYLANGINMDWAYGQNGTYAFSPEIGGPSDGFWPLPARIPQLYEDVRPGLTMSAMWAGAWPEATGATWTEVSGDGDAWREPGEVWELAVVLRNPGLARGTGSLSLASSSSAITVEQPDSTFGVGPQVFATQAGSHQAGTLLHVPLRIAIAPGTPSGTVQLQLTLVWDGLPTLQPFPVEIGQPRVLAFDDGESGSLGWSVSNALNYSWELAVPQQTTSGSQIVQPGSDHTSGSGTRCWVTGAAAGASASTNDVDGTTVLTSARLRASGFAHLELEYARWFACLPGGPLDDHLLVQVSSNDGTSWTTLENPGNANSWNVVRFSLENYVALTDTLRLRVTASDNPNNDLTEGLVDDLVLRTSSSLPTLGAWGASNAGASARLFVDGVASQSWRIRISSSAGPGASVPGVAGLDYLTGSVTNVGNGTADANGRAATSWSVPSGTTWYLQAICAEGTADAAFSQLLTFQVQ